MTRLSYDRYGAEIVAQTDLADTLRAAGPDAQVWTPVPEGATTPVFWARRFAHETVIHRADATLAVGTLHFHATDTAPEAAAEWLIDLTGDTIVWRRAHEKAAVAVRGPLTDLLLVVYRRRPALRQACR